MEIKSYNGQIVKTDELTHTVDFHGLGRVEMPNKGGVEGIVYAVIAHNSSMLGKIDLKSVKIIAADLNGKHYYKTENSFPNHDMVIDTFEKTRDNRNPITKLTNYNYI